MAVEHDAILRNLNTLAALPDDARLRLIAHEGTQAEIGRTTMRSHYLGLEDRWWFQSIRRTFTGDSGRVAIAYIKTELLPAVKNLAREATDAQRTKEPAPTLFESTPVATLQKLSVAVQNAVRGIYNMKHSTYANSSDIGVELMLISYDMTGVVAKINEFLESQMCCTGSTRAR